MQLHELNSDLATLVRWAETGALLVVGDLMLDEYIRGTVTRISPEAPVPVLQVGQKFHRAGGAANVAMNLCGLGCKVLVAGIIGDDEDGCRLGNILKKTGVDTSAVITVDDRPTTVKTRIQDERQQMLRLDKEASCQLAARYYSELTRRISQALKSQEIHAIICSDYDKGVLSKGLCCATIEMAQDYAIPVLVNPKGNDYSRYTGATMISANRLELAVASGRDPEDFSGLLEASSHLRDELQLEFLTMTLGASGIVLVQEGGISYFPAVAKEVFDVSGAGDTVLATIATAICAGIKPEKAVELANAAAGIVVGSLGTSPITIAELAPAVMYPRDDERPSKIYPVQELIKTAAKWRQIGNRVVFVNGCFDLLHPGHVALIERARNCGDRLIVALNTDRSVKALKGPTRPVLHENQRAAMLAALSGVDAVVLFDEPTPIELIIALHPDVLVKGGDYREDEIVGAKEVRTWGGNVVIAPLIEGLSTSSIIKRMLHQVPSNGKIASVEQC